MVAIEQEEAKAMLLSVWDSKAKETLRIDLWTKRYASRRNETILSSNISCNG